jgi:hypothetical protein
LLLTRPGVAGPAFGRQIDASGAVRGERGKQRRGGEVVVAERVLRAEGNGAEEERGSERL